MEYQYWILGFIVFYIVYKLMRSKKIDYSKDIQDIINNEDYKIKSRYE